MTLFHVGPKGSGACSATKGKCPFGGDSEHYTSQLAASQAYERTMEAQVLLAHKKLPKAKSFPAVANKNYRQQSHYGSFTPLSHADLMAVPREEFGAFIARIENNSPEVAAYSEAKKEREELALVVWDLRKELARYGSGRKSKDILAKSALEGKLDAATDSFDKIRAHMNSLGDPGSRADEYMMAKTAYAVTAPERVVDGIKLKPGEGIVRALYSTKGDLLGLVQFNMRGPNQGFAAVDADGKRTPFKSSAGKPEDRYDRLKADGYVLGPVVTPVSLMSNLAGGSFHRAKVARGSLTDNPARAIADFDKGPQGWANLAEKQDAQI